jgi:hypothetical protein
MSTKTHPDGVLCAHKVAYLFLYLANPGAHDELPALDDLSHAAVDLIL